MSRTSGRASLVAVPVSLRHRVQGLFRQHDQLLRAPAQRLKQSLSILAFRLRNLVASEPSPPRVVSDRRSVPCPAVPHPAIAALCPEGLDPGRVDAFLAAQTETSVTRDRAASTSFCVTAEGKLGGLPATHLESLLLAAAAEDLDLVVAGWAAPAPGRFGPSGLLVRRPGTSPAALTLLRLPSAERRPPRPVCGRSVCHIAGPDVLEGATAVDLSPLTRSGPYLLGHDPRPGSVVRQRFSSVGDALLELPAVEGPPTAMFLLSFLAVGGAESLLFDLIEGLAGRYRLLVVTVEPHLEALGQTVDRCRSLTPHVYTLGDWLPRAALHGAISHLIRRWRAATLVCWNGSTFFYDHVARLRLEHPELRILNQLFNHEGGWIEHYSPRLANDVDLHLAVNQRIARALCEERGVPPERVVTVHHGVRIPPLPDDGERERRKLEQRRALGLPLDRVVVGTFIRLHPQKRPLDVIRLARRMAGRDLHFLLVGGGPLDAEVEREIANGPLPSLTRLPMRRDVGELYDALDLCLLVSEYEGLPVFLLDGLARAIPCVATAVGEVPELLTDGGGVVVARPGDLDALEAGIEALLDPERRREQGAIGRATVARRFGLERYVQAYEAAIFAGQERRVTPDE